MTITDTLRASVLHVLATLQIDHLWLLQEGIGTSEEIQERLRWIAFVEREVELLDKAAASYADGFSRYVASGGAANRPSKN